MIYAGQACGNARSKLPKITNWDKSRITLALISAPCKHQKKQNLEAFSRNKNATKSGDYEKSDLQKSVKISVNDLSMYRS